MGDYLYALQRASNSSDMEWIRTNDKNYIAYGGPVSYPDGRVTPLGKIVSTFDENTKDALYNAGLKNYSLSPRASVSQMLIQYEMTGDINPIDIMTVKENLSRYTSGIENNSYSLTFSILIFEVGFGVSNTNHGDFVFGVLGLTTSFKPSMNFSISASGKTIYEGPQGPEFSFGISPFGCEGTKIKIPNYGASVEVKFYSKGDYVVSDEF